MLSSVQCIFTVPCQAAEAGVLPLWKSLVPRGGKLDDCTVVVAFPEPT